MAEFCIAVVVSIIGYVVGGIVGLNTEAHAWSPACWWGVAAVWGICICGLVGSGSGCHDHWD